MASTNANTPETSAPPPQGADSHTTEADYQTVLYFDAPPEQVFAALTTTEGIGGWWAPARGSGAEGGELQIIFTGVAQMDGLVLEEDPLVLRVETAQQPHTVAWTVRECGFLPDWVGTSPRFEVAPHGNGGCEVRFRHQGLTPRLECYESCKPGWDYHLASLHDYVEFGRGRPFGSEATETPS